MVDLKLRTLIAAGTVALAGALGATSASAAACQNTGAVMTDIDGTGVSFAADDCEGSFDGNLNPSDVESMLDDGTFFSAYAAFDWEYLGKDEDVGDDGSPVQADIGATSGGWSIDFTPDSVNVVVLLLKGGPTYSLFLWDTFVPTPGSSFAGTFDTALAGLETGGGDPGPGLSHLDAAGLFVIRDCPPGTVGTPPVCRPVTDVPVPASLPLLMAGLAITGYVARRKTR